MLLEDVINYLTTKDYPLEIAKTTVAKYYDVFINCASQSAEDCGKLIILLHQEDTHKEELKEFGLLCKRCGVEQKVTEDFCAYCADYRIKELEKELLND